MEKELNIAAILKDKPNARIYDLLHNIYVKLDNISTTDKETVIWCTKEYPDKTSHFGYSELGTERGWLDGLQILKPSEEMQDWSKFAWKKGDVLVSKDEWQMEFCIFDSFCNDTYTLFTGKYHNEDEPHFNEWHKSVGLDTEQFYKATDKEVQEIIKKIEKHYGGKLNLSTLQIEQPKPEFKDGDIVVAEGNGKDKKIFIFRYKIRDSNNDEHGYKSYIALNSDGSLLNTMFFYLREDIVYRLATDSEKQQLFSALEKEGKVWNPDTKQIEDLPKKCELKPFDKVLVRDTDSGIWMPTLFGFYDKEFCNYVCLNETFQKCIPYNDQTKHLIGTTGEWKGGEA